MNVWKLEIISLLTHVDINFYFLFERHEQVFCDELIEDGEDDYQKWWEDDYQKWWIKMEKMTIRNGE